MSQIRPGMKIAVTAGSRGIANVALITRTIVDFVREGAKPFIVAAMGSHGGATKEGQLAVLSGLGITEETMGCPIKADMDVVKIGVNEEGMDVMIGRNAWEADGIIVSCRIKPPHLLQGPVRERHDEDDGHRPRQAGRSRVCHEAGFKYMAKYAHVRKGHPAAGQHSVRGGRFGERLRRDR